MGGVCVCNATPPKEKSRKGSKFPQLGGSGMLELHSGMLELQVEKGLKKKIVFEVDLRKERGSNVFVTPPPPPIKPPLPLPDHAGSIPEVNCGKNYCVLFLLKWYICQEISFTYIPSPLVPYCTF